jgi:Sulfotransferase domain
VDTDAEYIDQLARDVRLLYERWAARRNELLVVRYEDLILSPVTTLEEVFAYLDVDESAQTVEAVRLAASKSAEAAQVQHQTSRSQDQSVGRWCTDLTPELIDRSQRALGPYLDAFGYTTSREGSHASTA